MKEFQLKLKEEIIRLFEDLKKELIWKDIVKSLIFPVIITFIFFLPNYVKNVLVLRPSNPMWWQYVTGMLVHKEVPHFLGNLLGYILIFSLLLIFSIKSKKKHSLFPAFLILTTIVIMVRISFYDLIFKEHEMLGSSEIIYGLIGLIPAYCPIHLKKGLNKYLPWLLVIILLFAFHVCTSINSEEIADIPHFIGIICGIISGFLVVNIKEIKKWTKRTMWK